MPQRTAKSVEKPVVRASPTESERAAQAVLVNNFIMNYPSAEPSRETGSLKLYLWAILSMITGIAAFWVDWRAAVVLLLISAGLNSASGVEKPRC